MPISAAAASLDPPPRPARYRYCFFELGVNAKTELQFIPHRRDGAPYQILRTGRQRRVIHLKRNTFFRHERERQRVVQRNRLKNRAQLVVIVRAAAQDVEA